MLVFFLQFFFFGWGFGGRFFSAGGTGRWGSGTDIADTKGRGNNAQGKDLLHMLGNLESCYFSVAHPDLRYATDS